MSDSQPPMPSRPQRPLYLLVALFAAWALGLGGIMVGCVTISVCRDPGAILSEATRMETDGALEGFVEALDLRRGSMIPLAAANTVLSSLLVVACSRALASKRNARSLALQAVIANIMYAIVGYFVSAPVREAYVASTVAMSVPGQSQPVDTTQLAATIDWNIRLMAAIRVAVLCFVAYSLTRPRVIAFFQPPEESGQSEEA